MRPTTIAVLQEVGERQYVPFFNQACPIWVEGSHTSKDHSILVIDVDISKELDMLERGIVGRANFCEDELTASVNNTLGFVGLMYKLSLCDIEIITTAAMNERLAPWQEPRLPTHPGDDDANAAKAILVWTSYWVNYALNLGAVPYLKIGV